MSRTSFSRVAAIVAIAAFVLGASTPVHAQETPPPAAAAAQPVFYPIAIFPFQEKGREVTDQGGKVTDILFAQLVTNPDVYLVEREELKKILQELAISAAGLTDPKQSTQVGQLTGAKILITGSVFEVSGKTYVVAKLIGTETSRVVGASSKGNVGDDLDTIVEALAKNVAEKLKTDGKLLIPAPMPAEDRFAALVAELGKATSHPSVYIDVTERHIGSAATNERPIFRAVPDPAVETELAKICNDLGFKVIDRQTGSKADADVLLVGEAFSQFASRHENFNSVRARVELKAVDRRTGRLLAVDRQTAVGVDLSELVASKGALQDATLRLTCRLLPVMFKTKSNEWNP